MASAGITLKHVGKRYNREWIFRGVDHTFKPNGHTVIRGANGSGKSTLLQVILGSTVASEGRITYNFRGKETDVTESLGMFSIAAPYLELIEEFTLREMLAFHRKMKPFKDGLQTDTIVEQLYLKDAANKAIKYYSSGMKQRVKLGIALLSDTPFVLLDEPTSNLDAQAIEWYKNLVNSHKKGRTIIVCSNDQQDEFSLCKEQLDISDYKNASKVPVVPSSATP